MKSNPSFSSRKHCTTSMFSLYEGRALQHSLVIPPKAEAVLSASEISFVGKYVNYVEIDRIVKTKYISWHLMTAYPGRKEKTNPK